MKRSFHLVIVFIAFSSLFSSCSYSDKGFTDKSEAKNKFTDQVKEGKWIEYCDSLNNILASSENYNFYRLLIYDKGKPFGLVNQFYPSGQLQGQVYLQNTSPIKYTNGNQIYFNPSGTIKEKFTTDQSGSKTGKLTKHDDSGQIILSCIYNEDSPKDSVIRYNNDGSVDYEINYYTTIDKWVKKIYDGGELKYYYEGNLKPNLLFERSGKGLVYANEKTYEQKFKNDKQIGGAKIGRCTNPCRWCGKTLYGQWNDNTKRGEVYEVIKRVHGKEVV